jgi:hypothetical protein
MNSVHRSILARASRTGAALLTVMMMGTAVVRAESVFVQGSDGANGANAVNSGDPGLPGGDGESVAANAGSVNPITFPLNQATAIDGSGGESARMNEHRPAARALDRRAHGRQRRQRVGYIGASPRTAIGGFEEGAVVAFASDPLSNF